MELTEELWPCIDAAAANEQSTGDTSEAARHQEAETEASGEELHQEGVPDTLSAPLHAYLEECLSNLVGPEWSEHDLRTLVRQNPKISIGKAAAWVVAETRGTALNLAVKYLLPGERRGKQPWAFYIPPKAWWRRRLWHGGVLGKHAVSESVGGDEGPEPG